MPLTEAQHRVDAWIAQFEEGYFDPLTNMARLSEEVGELAREVNHRFGLKTKKKGESDGDLAMEMADILFVIICMANREGIDLQAALGEVSEIARSLDLTAYDAAYLALAARRGLALATVDDRLRRTCERAGVELV